MANVDLSANKIELSKMSINNCLETEKTKKANALTVICNQLMEDY